MLVEALHDDDQVMVRIGFRFRVRLGAMPVDGAQIVA